MKSNNTSESILFLLFILGLNGFPFFHWIFGVENIMCLKSIYWWPTLKVNHDWSYFIDDWQRMCLSPGLTLSMTCRTRVKFIAMMTKEGSNKIANFMSLCKGVTMTLKLLLQWICIFYSTLIAIILRDYNAAFLCHCWFLLYPTQRVAEGIMFLTRLSYFYSQRNSSETA